MPTTNQQNALAGQELDDAMEAADDVLSLLDDDQVVKALIEQGHERDLRAMGLALIAADEEARK